MIASADMVPSRRDRVVLPPSIVNTAKDDERRSSKPARRCSSYIHTDDSLKGFEQYQSHNKAKDPASSSYSYLRSLTKMIVHKQHHGVGRPGRKKHSPSKGKAHIIRDEMDNHNSASTFSTACLTESTAGEETSSRSFSLSHRSNGGGPARLVRVVMENEEFLKDLDHTDTTSTTDEEESSRNLLPVVSQDSNLSIVAEASFDDPLSRGSNHGTDDDEKDADEKDSGLVFQRDRKQLSSDLIPELPVATQVALSLLEVPKRPAQASRPGSSHLRVEAPLNFPNASFGAAPPSSRNDSNTIHSFRRSESLNSRKAYCPGHMPTPQRRPAERLRELYQDDVECLKRNQSLQGFIPGYTSRRRQKLSLIGAKDIDKTPDLRVCKRLYKGHGEQRNQLMRRLQKSVAEMPANLHEKQLLKNKKAKAKKKEKGQSLKDLIETQHARNTSLTSEDDGTLGMFFRSYPDNRFFESDGQSWLDQGTRKRTADVPL